MVTPPTPLDGGQAAVDGDGLAGHETGLVCLGDLSFEDLTFLIDGPPEIMCIAGNFHENLIDMPAPNRINALLYLSFPDSGREERTKPVPPVADTLVANINAALVQQILVMAQRQRITDIHDHCQLDDLWRCLEIAKR